MPGDDRVRYCTLCHLNVYNLSAMTRAEAEAFVTAEEGPGCIRFLRRKDGTIQTRDCPQATEMARAATRLLVGRLVAFAALLLGLVVALTPRRDDDQPTRPLRSVEPFKTALDWLDPPPTRTFTAGECMPLPAANPAPANAGKPGGS